MIGSGRWRRRGLVGAVVVGVLLLAGALMADRWADDPYGGAFTGPCEVVAGANGRVIGELRLTDHGPPVQVGRVAVAFSDSAGERLATVRVEVGSNGADVSVAHDQTRTFPVAAPSGAVTCQFVDWASGDATTWGGQGAG
jgi:hypothetical protein